MQKVVLEEDHEDTIKTKYGIAICLYDKKEFNGAEQLYIEVENVQIGVLGEKHVDTLNTKHWFARCLYNKNQFKEAEKLLKELETLQKEVLGEEHTDTINYKFWIAREKHLDTINTKYWFARYLYNENQFDEAKKLLRDVYNMRMEHFGDKHLDTLNSKYCIGRSPKDLREIITSLCDSLSHAHLFKKKIELENSKNPQFVHKTQNDLQKIKIEIIDILYKKKVDAFKIFLNQIIKHENLQEVKKLINSLRKANYLDKLKLQIKPEKLQEIEQLVIQISDSITLKEHSNESNNKNELLYKIFFTIELEAIEEAKDKGKFQEGLKAKKQIYEVQPKLDAVFSKLKDGKIKQDSVRQKEYESLGRALWFNEMKKKITMKQNELNKKFEINKRDECEKIGLADKINTIIDNNFKENTEQLSKRLEALKRLVPDNNLELIQKYNQNKKLQAAVEMLVLDLAEILENKSLLGNNRLFFHKDSLILIGKSLRNYLAHGDALIDALLFDPSIAIISNAIKFLLEGKDLVTKGNIIGQKIVENPSDLNNYYNQSLDLVFNQNEMFIATNIHIDYINSQKPFHIAATFGSNKIIKYHIKKKKKSNNNDIDH
nr:uncharacterized protein LOC124819000 [Hydra vulgaris]